MSFTFTTFAPLTLLARNQSASPRSVVVPAMTASRLPARSLAPLMPDAVVTSRLPPSTKVVRLKSTCSRRESVCVVEPHSRSTLPPATAVIRLSDVTPTHLI